jgi:gliding motility-associated-like protein
MSFNSSTGILAGTPSNNDVGTHSITLRVNDGTIDVDQTFTITVNNTNDTPVITSIAITAAEEDELYTFTFTASDVDQGDVITYTTESLPSWLTFDTTSGVLLGTPSNDDIGIHTITLRASDGVRTVDQTFVITVANANDAPIITSTPTTSIDEDAGFHYTLQASDIDGDQLTFSATGLPAWLTFKASTAELHGTPANADVGTHEVTLKVSDGNTTIEQTFVITVNNINDAPVVTSSEESSAKENSVYTYTIQAEDVDEDAVLTYATSTLPSWLNFNPSTGTLQGTPTSEDAGTFEITVTVSDGITTTEQVITIVVAPNIKPVVSTQNFSIDEKSATGTTVGQLIATDEDGNSFNAWSITGGNDEGAFAINTTTGEISVANESALDFETRSIFSIMVTVSDGFDASDPAAITISLNDVSEGLQFYSAFSPNGDTVNETWDIDGLEAYPNSVLKIFNADGMELFNNVGYTTKWNGVYKGKEMPLGTYYYIINLNDGSGKKLNGHFMIIK